MPMVTARLALVLIHPLLHNRPLAVGRNNETVQVKIEAVLHGSTINLRHQAACTYQIQSIDAKAIAEILQFFRSLARMLAAAAAHIDTEFTFPRSEASLQGSDDAGGNAGGMPVHSHYRAERLKPEGVRQPLEKRIPPIVMDNGFRDDDAQC